MVTDTLRAMSMGIRQVSRDASSHLPTFNWNIQKILHSMRTNKSIEIIEISETTPFCGRYSMQAKLLQLTAFKWVLLQSSKLLRLEDLGSFLRQFLWLFCGRVCSGFRVLFRGGGSKNLWKTELDWVLGIPFRRKTHTGWSTSPDSVLTSFFLFKAFEIRWGTSLYGMV